MLDTKPRMVGSPPLQAFVEGFEAVVGDVPGAYLGRGIFEPAGEPIPIGHRVRMVGLDGHESCAILPYDAEEVDLLLAVTRHAWNHRSRTGEATH